MHSSTALKPLRFPIKKEESRSELRSTKKSKKAVDKRDEAVYRAKMAERSQRYDDMLDKMKVVAKMEVALTAEEKGLLSRALNHVLTVLLSSWRNLYAMEREEVTRGNDINVERVKKYIKSVEKEIDSICDKAQSLVVNYLEPHCSSNEDHVYYLKMVGDCFMAYCYEFKTGADKHAYVHRLRCIYEEAARIAKKKLSDFNQIRLGVALSLSIFWNEIAGSPQRAIAVAWEAFDDAMIGFDIKLDPDSLRIMATLRENIDKWTRESHTGTSRSGEMAEQNAAKRLKR